MTPLAVKPEDDARIRAILEEAKQLHASLEPLYTWDDLLELIGSCQLAALSRQPAFESLYAETFNPFVKSVYGKMENYLRKQLGWAVGEGVEGREYWDRKARTNVRRNDWPYGVPRDVSHWVVWVPLPLFHPALCTPTPSRASTPLPSSLLSSSSSFTPSPSGTSTPSGLTTTNPLAQDHVAPTKGTWDWVSRNGLSGLTGRAEERWRELRRERRRAGWEGGGEGVEEGEEADGREEEEEYDEQTGPEREIAAFVRGRWKEEDGWETACPGIRGHGRESRVLTLPFSPFLLAFTFFSIAAPSCRFANPPGLQSVPGLAHFHVLARNSGGAA